VRGTVDAFPELLVFVELRLGQLIRVPGRVFALQLFAGVRTLGRESDALLPSIGIDGQ
jgi:hypothetical protein